MWDQKRNKSKGVLDGPQYKNGPSHAPRTTWIGFPRNTCALQHTELNMAGWLNWHENQCDQSEIWIGIGTTANEMRESNSCSDRVVWVMDWFVPVSAGSKPVAHNAHLLFYPSAPISLVPGTRTHGLSEYCEFAKLSMVQKSCAIV